MKVTIAQLQERIESLEKEKNSWYEKYYELKEAQAKQEQMKLVRLDEEQRQTERQVGNLMEIIRWQTNGKTAESPFMPTKEQRDERGGNRY